MKISNKITPSGAELLKLLKKEVTQGQSLSPTYVLAAKSYINELKMGVHHKSGMHHVYDIYGVASYEMKLAKSKEIIL